MRKIYRERMRKFHQLSDFNSTLSILFVQIAEDLLIRSSIKC